MHTFIHKHKISILTTSLFMLFLLTISVIILGVSNFSRNSASAHTALGFNAGNIMSDQVMRSSASMSVNQIQSFLNSKGINCTSGSNCLKNYRENGKSAAQIIYDVGRQYNINPQVLIVLLQKEVGIVTMNNPESWRYRTAAGYGCPDSTPNVCNSNYYGFTNQLRWAATMFDAILRNSPTWYAPYTVGNNNILLHPHNNCGTQRVNIQNRATAALYSYTPYVPNQAALGAGYGEGDRCSSYGNRNFFAYFTDWFGSTQGTPFFKVSGSDRVYILGEGDTYYYVPNHAILRAYGYTTLTSTISTYSPSYISSKTLTGTLGTFARFEGNEIYHLDSGIRRHATSRQLLEHYGTEIGKEAKLPAYLLEYPRNGGQLHQIVHSKNDGRVYIMENGKRRHFTGPSAYNSGRPSFSSKPSATLSTEYVNSLPYGPAIYAFGSLVRADKKPEVYLVINQHEMAHVGSPSLLGALGHATSPVTSIASSQVNAYRKSATPLSTFVRIENGAIRLFDSDKSVRAVPASIANASSYNIDASRLVGVDGSITDQYRANGSVTPLLRAHGTHEVYLISNGKRQHVSSRERLQSLGYTYDDVSDVAAYTLGLFPVGKKL